MSFLLLFPHPFRLTFASLRCPLGHPSHALFHALALSPSLTFSVALSLALSVRFHPRRSTFHVYRTIARAPITVTGRATSWLAVDVGGGRTAERRRPRRRRRRRRRRGRAQQTASEARRATERNSWPAEGKRGECGQPFVISLVILEEARASCCLSMLAEHPPRRPSRTLRRSDRSHEYSFEANSKPQRNAESKADQSIIENNRRDRCLLSRGIVVLLNGVEPLERGSAVPLDRVDPPVRSRNREIVRK